jgi:glycosyltransferase involved in cell wall biosynthesis
MTGSLRVPSVRRAVRRVLRTLGPAPRHLLARAVLVLPDGGRSGGRVGAFLSSVRARALSGVGRPDDAVRYALERASRPGTRRRLAMAVWLEGRGQHRAALQVVAEPLPEVERASLRARWQLTHARAARSLGRYAEATEAADAALAAVPGDSAAKQERKRVVQVVDRYQRVPSVARSATTETPVDGRPLHLVEVSIRDVQSGYTIRTHHVATAQLQAGLDPHVLVVGAEPPKGILTTSIDGVAYRWLPGAVGLRRASSTSWDDLAAQAADVVAELRPTVIHAATPPTVGNLGRALARWSGLPLVYEVRGFRDEFWRISHGEDENVDHAVLSRQADTDTMREADSVVTLGEQMKAEVIERGAAAERVAIVPNAVDTARFRPGPRDPGLAASYGIERSDVVIGYISSFQPYEDFATLVDAIAILRDRGRPVRGLLVGDGSTLGEIRRRVASRGMQDVIRLPGRIPHAAVPQHHRLIDVFVVPRIATRLAQLVTPLKPLEAMASGRALAVARLDALTETVVPGQTGVTFEPGDAADLASVVERLVLDPFERRRLGEAARTWVERERTLARNGQRYREIYARLGVPLGFSDAAGVTGMAQAPAGVVLERR